MAFRVPTFNLTCDIRTGDADPPVAPRVGDVPCQLRAAGRQSSGQVADNEGWPFLWMVLLPPLTDIRDTFTPGGADSVEVPVGSGRVYKVILVDDVAKGFDNEYRIALVVKHDNWPVPIP